MDIKEQQDKCREDFDYLIRRSVKDRFHFLQVSVDGLKEQNKDQDKKLNHLAKSQREMMGKVGEMHQVFTGAKFLNKTVLWFVGVISAIGGLVLLIREIFKK